MEMVRSAPFPELRPRRLRESGCDASNCYLSAEEYGVLQRRLKL